MDGRSSSDKGLYSLVVDRYAKATNNTCAAATRLTLSGGKASVTSPTVGATSTVNLTSSDCTSYSSPGPDVFYSVILDAGKT